MKYSDYYKQEFVGGGRTVYVRPLCTVEQMKIMLEKR